MSSRSNVGTHWKRPATHVYDYNYNIGEHYYKPQLNYADKRFSGRAGSPPKAQTFAERFAADPVYGNYGPPNLRGVGFGQPRRASDDLGFSRRPLLDEDSLFARRKPAMDDDDLGFRRKPLKEDEFFKRRPFEDEDLRFNNGGADDFVGRPRFDFGEKLLDAAGARMGRQRASPSPFRAGGANPKSSRAMDEFEDEFFKRSKRNVPRSADPDFEREDPFKMRNAKALGLADDFDDDFGRDSESVVDRIRSKLRARKEKEEGLNSAVDDDFGQSRIDQLRSKAKARMADLDDDFGDMSFSTKPRRAAGNDAFGSLGSKYLNDMDSSGTTGSKSVHIKKRTVRTTVDSD